MSGSGRRRDGRSAGRQTVLAVVSALVIVVAACGPEASGDVPTRSEAPIATPTVTLYQLNTTVWYAGLVLDFTSATAVFDPTGGTVTVVARFENPGTDDATPDFPIRITAGGQGFDPVHGTQMPSVPAGGSADVLMSFDVPGRPSVDDAVLRIGRSEANQGLVPFGNGPVEPQTLEPLTIPASGTANAGDLRVTVKGAGLRWDLPDWSDELPVNVAALTITYDALYHGPFAGGLAFTADNVSLTLPDGTSVKPRQDGRSQSVVLLQPGKAQAGLMSRFEIPSGLAGTYVLVIRNGAAKATVKLTIPASG